MIIEEKLDPVALKADFPTLAREVRGKPLAYLDNAASAQKPLAVIEAVSEFYRAHYANIHRGVHTLSEEATVAYEEARDKVAAFIHAPDRRGVIGVVVRNGRLLLIRRGPDVVAPGMYCFPGGGIEGDESEPEALVREFREELGVEIIPVRPIWKSVAPWKVRLSWWLADLPGDAELNPNPAEVASVHWFAPDEIADLSDSLPSNFEFLAALSTGEIDLA